MPFINREPELNYLNQVFNKQGSSLVIIYGRRRIGKTTLKCSHYYAIFSNSGFTPALLELSKKEKNLIPLSIPA